MREHNFAQVVVSLGSNQGGRIHHLARGVTALQAISTETRFSAVYETDPVGYVDQSDFLNLAVQITTQLTARELLEYLLKVEHDNGRVRSIRYGPRTLDMDILLFNNDYICFRDLQIPHPRMWERAFVIRPCADLFPNRKALGGKTFEDLANQLTGKGEVRYVGRFW